MRRATPLQLALALSAVGFAFADEKPGEFPKVDAADLKGVARTRFDSPDPTAAQLERRKANTAAVKAMGLPVLADLPVVEDEKAIKPRAAKDVARRSIAVLACAVKGETLGKDQELIDGFLDDWSAEGFLSPEEREFVRDEKPERQDLIDFAWRYECHHVFLWALGHIKELKPPHEICTVRDEVRIVADAGPEKFIGGAELRPMSEILDQADLYYRLHWAAVELRIRGKESDKVHEGIVRERHRALNWLIRYLDQQWDEVTTDT